MPRFDRYILSQLTIMFSFFSLVLVAIYWLNQAVGLFEQLIGDGQSALVFLEFTALTLPNIVRLVLPLAAFAGTVQVMNRMRNESELVVMQAAGCSPWRLARPILLFGLMVATLASVLTHGLVPASQAQLSERRSEISRDVTARFLSEGEFLHPAAGITFYIRHVTDAGELRDIFLSDARQDDQRITYTAKRALLVEAEGGPKLVMFDGMAQTYGQDSRRLTTARFADFTFDIGRLISDRGALPQRLRVQSTPALLFPSETMLENTGATRAEALQEAHSRFSSPLMAIAGAVIGYGALLMGGFSRLGIGRQVALAIGLLIALHLMDNSAADIARQNAGLWPVSYLAPLCGIAVGAILIALSGRRRRLPRGVSP